MATTQVSLKLLIDTKDHRVLFAEAGKDCVDFLFNILSLPVGTVIRLLTKEDMVGCIGNLYGSIENISDTYIQPNQNKDSLLMPKLPNHAANVPLLLTNIESSTSGNFYRCGGGSYSNCRVYMSNVSSAICPQCKNCMNQQLTFVNPPDMGSSSNEGGYVKGVVTYMVMDDLVVTPMSTISSITLLNKFSVKDVGALEEKVVDLDVDKGVKLLKASLQSKTVLTDIFLGKKGEN